MEVVLVAVVTGVSALGASFLTGFWTYRTARWRGRHERRLEEDRRRFQQAQERTLDVRDRFDQAARAVLQLGVTVRVVAHVRSSGAHGGAEAELAELLRQARQDAVEAGVAVERLRGVVPPRDRVLTEELREAADQAFIHGQTATGPVAEAARVQRELDARLRRIEETLFPALAVPWDRGGGPDAGAGTAAAA
ncbi:hypothetical protein HNR10_005714 [Nocardiopsis aegyptia]|uniref:Uncharacterized protein n=1 Tax=Nocardiopsis aegyptia TaxID=220378 RepID=A0A7Z0JCU7_9ACTN|nr:hypothetical protein [Nocardiopsis aegyptia]